MRISFIVHAHNPRGMHTSAVVLGIDATRTLTSDNDVSLRLSLSAPLFFSSQYQTFVVTEYLGGAI